MTSKHPVIAAQQQFISTLWKGTSDLGKWDSVGTCPECSDEISRYELGNGEVAVNLTGDTPILYNYNCCPCTGDQKAVKDHWIHLGITGDYGDYHGSLALCPFCLRIYDDRGEEVHP